MITILEYFAQIGSGAYDPGAGALGMAILIAILVFALIFGDGDGGGGGCITRGDINPMPPVRAFQYGSPYT
ncbi:MAG: hypothetical protein H6814_08945 [Phycisphaeraceae bacterium]|nr:hypothetical protein [Phycisphaeraceae bacterium]